MKRYPAYSIHREYFGYPKGKNPRLSLLYAMSICETNEIVKQVCIHSDLAPFQSYEKKLRKSGLTVKFLKRAQIFFQNLESLNKLIFVEAEFRIDCQQLGITSSGPIVVTVSYIINPADKEIVILAFSHADAIFNELKMLKGLRLYFDMINPWPPEYDRFSYWDVSTGLKCSENLSNVEPIAKEEILAVLRRLTCKIGA